MFVLTWRRIQNHPGHHLSISPVWCLHCLGHKKCFVGCVRQTSKLPLKTRNGIKVNTHKQEHTHLCRFLTVQYQINLIFWPANGTKNRLDVFWSLFCFCPHSWWCANNWLYSRHSAPWEGTGITDDSSRDRLVGQCVKYRITSWGTEAKLVIQLLLHMPHLSPSHLDCMADYLTVDCMCRGIPIRLATMLFQESTSPPPSQSWDRHLIRTLSRGSCLTWVRHAKVL